MPEDERPTGSEAHEDPFAARLSKLSAIHDAGDEPYKERFDVTARAEELTLTDFASLGPAVFRLFALHGRTAKACSVRVWIF
jgi:hypothetical protein